MIGTFCKEILLKCTPQINKRQNLSCIHAQS